MNHRAWLSTVVLSFAVLAGACGGSRKGASNTDAANDGPAGSDAGADKADTGGSDAPKDMAIEVAPEVGTEVGMETAMEVAPEVGMEVGPEVPAACATIPTTATLTSHLKITADNECEVFVNGTSVGMTNNWGVAVTIDVSLFVHPGRKNVIAVRGTNTSSQGGNDRGIIGELTVDADGGVAPLVVTNDAWRTSMTVPDADAGAGPDWTALNYDDSAWSAATEIAANGDGPWGAVLGSSTAKWIWSAPVPADTANKPNLETAYARRTFYFSLDGASIASTPACP
jgi:hypothetical protein